MEPNNLIVSVKSARELTLKGHTRLDVFATLVLHGKGSWKSRIQTEVFKTQTSDAEWNEDCEFNIDDLEARMTVTVLHHTRIGINENIGAVEFTLSSVRGLRHPAWYDLHKRAGEQKIRGQILLKFDFSYKRPALSVSSLTLNQPKAAERIPVPARRRLPPLVEKATSTVGVKSRRRSCQCPEEERKVEEGHLAKLKRKVRLGSHGRRLSDGASMASSVSVSTGQRQSFADPDSSILAHADRSHGNGYMPGYPPLDETQQEESFRAPSASFLRLPATHTPEPSTHETSKRHTTILPASVLPPSPSLSTASSITGHNNGFQQQPPRPSSAASSGYGPDELEREVRELRRELANKEAQLGDMKEYMERIVSRALEMCPQILEISPKKATVRSARFVY